MKAPRRALSAVIVAAALSATVSVVPAGAAAKPKVTVGVKKARVQVGQVADIIGKATPAAPGKPVKLQRYSANAWHGYKQKKLTAKSSYDFGVKLTVAGTYKFRVVAPHATSKPVTLTVTPKPRTTPPRAPISPK